MTKTKDKSQLERMLSGNMELSDYCKGELSTFIEHNQKHYCMLAKFFPSNNIRIHCKHLYDFTDFPRACMYNHKFRINPNYTPNFDEENNEFFTQNGYVNK